MKKIVTYLPIASQSLILFLYLKVSQIGTTKDYDEVKQTKQLLLRIKML